MTWGPSIEGETPLPERSGLRNKSAATRADLNLAEAANIAYAALKYLAAKPRRSSAKFDYAWLLRLHREMFGKVWKWAGEPRQQNLNLGCDWSQVPNQLVELIAELRYREAHWPDLLEQAAHLHYGAVWIHPFLNGNGRWARMLGNIWLKLHRHNITVWPNEVGESRSSIREEYLQCVRTADAGDLRPFIQLHRRFTLEN